MTHEEKIQWMIMWAHKNKCVLDLEGNCGIGRECVGILRGHNYPDYEWRDKETWDRIDENGEVWCPEDAYHKHECVAVLGRGQKAEEQLYDWLKWFDDNGFVVEEHPREMTGMSQLEIILHGAYAVRMVRKQKETA